MFTSQILDTLLTGFSGDVPVDANFEPMEHDRSILSLSSTVFKSSDPGITTSLIKTSSA